jgi:probable HAF family extracellular repeat protein
MRSMKYVLSFAAAILALTSFAPAQIARPGCAAAHYKIVPLPFQPAHINNSGVIVGTTEDHQPVLWTEKDGLHEIELPPGSAADALAINRTGDVVGTLTREGSARPYAFKYSGGKLTLLSDDPSKAAVIADSGETAGENANQLVLWRQGKLVPLGGCCGGTVRGINQHGQIVGQLNDKEGHFSAFLWDGHKISSIATPDGTMSSAVAINDAGYALVESYMPNEVFLWRSGKFTKVNLAPDVANQPLAFNNCDVIVGEFGASAEYYHAFVWDEKNGQRDLNTLIDANSGWTLEQPFDINDRGEIVGTGDHIHGEDSGFLLVPEPGSNH